MKIGEVARRSGVAVETVRFYEKQGLLDEPPRSYSGYRQYSDDAVARLAFIQRSKGLGFSLKEIEELLALRDHPDAASGDVKTRAEAKIAEIERKIRDLRQMRETLTKLVRSCSGEGPTSECAILNTIETGKQT
jgi:MerR family transcriptional regulator, copper efflux regulator